MWKDSSRFKEAAEKMKLTAKDLYEMKIIDKIIKEPIEMDAKSFKEVSEDMRKEIKNETKKLLKLDENQIIENRYEKFRNINYFKNV